MRVLLLGATGMVGQGALHECLAAKDVTEVVAIVRSPLERIPAMGLTEVRHDNFFDWSGVDLSGSTRVSSAWACRRWVNERRSTSV